MGSTYSLSRSSHDTEFLVLKQCRDNICYYFRNYMGGSIRSHPECSIVGRKDVLYYYILRYSVLFFNRFVYLGTVYSPSI
jgi:hypothetical protein